MLGEQPFLIHHNASSFQGTNERGNYGNVLYCCYMHSAPMITLRVWYNTILDTVLQG